MWNNKHRRTYAVFLLIEHERSNGLTGIGTITGLTTNADGGMTNAKMVNGAGDGARRGRH